MAHITINYNRNGLFCTVWQCKTPHFINDTTGYNNTLQILKILLTEKLYRDKSNHSIIAIDCIAPTRW